MTEETAVETPRRRGRPASVKAETSEYLNISKVICYFSDGWVKPKQKAKLTEKEAAAFGDKLIKVA